MQFRRKCTSTVAAEFIDKLLRLNIVIGRFMAAPQPTPPTANESTRRSPSGADLVLLLLLILVGFGIWAVVERGLTEALRNQQPNEQKIMDAHGVTKEKMDLAEVQNEIAEVQKYLNSARLEVMKQSAAVQSFVGTYPELANSTLSNNVPADSVRAYVETKRQSQAANSLVASLEQRLETSKTRANAIGSQLENHQEAAQSQYRWANGRYVVLKRLGTFVATLVIVIALMALVRWVLWLLAKNRRMSTAEGFRPFVFALAALVVLFAYDQFSYAGAAFIGILLLLLWLRRINWPNKLGVSAK